MAAKAESPCFLSQPPSPLRGGVRRSTPLNRTGAQITPNQKPNTPKKPPDTSVAGPQQICRELLGIGTPNESLQSSLPTARKVCYVNLERLSFRRRLV